MRLNGSMTRFRVSGAGAFFNEVSLNRQGETVDLGVTNDDRVQQFVDPNSRGATITARGYIEATSNTNFIDVCKVGKVVEVTDLTGVDQDEIDFYGPWQVRSCELSHRKRAASEESIELIGTGGAIPATFNPDTYGPPPA